MKKLIPILVAAFTVTACTSPEKAPVPQVLQQSTAPDTTGYAQFQQWRAQNELSAASPVQPQVQEPVKPVVVVREIIREQPVKQRVVQQPSAPVFKNSETEHTAKETTEDVETGVSSNGDGERVAQKRSEEGEPNSAETKEEKKGWSKSAKGAVIGGAGGAVIGAVINKKNPAVGAAIGGVLGGAVGYGIGKSKDKKDMQ